MEPDFSHTLRDGASGLSALLDTLEEDLAGRGVPVATVASVLIAADEVVSNALHHGGSPSVEVAGAVAEGRVTILIVDDGGAFDPLAAATPDTSLSVEDRDIGGLGIHLVRKMMDRVAYERRGKHNRLQFSKSYASPSASRQTAEEAS
ncbi:MAG: ATP-binding protein [Alphaproteobacteria bacterium]|nr:ATP-binding protein [Alphaproteobacteria bacterium]MBU1516054.1 ATP-binding protein [Alphaproteobacteria bacterium]MBU2092731.1 ATP-binding protein [Alphaproteobacteria bacterium]MBU2153744.1 ATP-binding protein [Alphaproteobacteria bacterium]MBU2308372.1 ATP-binding protein [Alphaproteobacteria bacterium]